MPKGYRFVLVVCFVVAIAMSDGGLGEARLQAQGGSTKTALTGTVVDSGGGVIPGATVVVTNDATGVSTNTVTNSDGAFNVPALDPGTYTVTVSLEGFKTSVIKDQRLVAASPANVKVAIEVGSLAETVTVRGGSELVQTQSGAVSSTLFTEQLKTVPLPTRNALYAVNMLPGVDTTGTVRDSTIAGLPEQAINITLDGVNVNNNQDKANDGFYAMVRPQLDAIEQVTLTTAAQGAESAGQGAVQIRFVTRSGTNTYRGTAYDYFRHPSLNSNSWLNLKNGLPKNEIILHQAGFSEGGPIVIPGLFNGRNKAFFFFNYERFYQPTEATRTRSILNPAAQRGLFTYNVTEGGQTVTRSVDVIDLARRNGQLATLDPTVSALLAEVRAAAQSTGAISTQPGATNAQQYVFLSPGKGLEHLPTSRVDFNLSEKHRLSGTYYWQQVNRLPDIQNNGDASFPGLTSRVNYLSHRTTGSVTLRSTLSPSLVNELVGGWQDSPGYFASGASSSQYANQAGFHLGFPLGLTNASTPYGQGNPTVEDPRNTPNWNIDNTVTWQKGNHSMSFGASFSQFGYTQTIFNTVPTINFGVQASLDPADAMFTGGTTGNFPGASTGNLNDARALYAFLTGRVTAINGTARLNDANEYVYLGRTSDKLQLSEAGTFVQDTWRITPTFTVNAGVRWEVQSPVVALNSNYSTATMADICGASGLGDGPGGRACNLFRPGVFNAPGAVSQYVQYAANEPGFKTDWNNVAPNISAAWRPNVGTGFLRRVLGDPDQATVRAGFSIAYNRNGMAEFQNIFGGNPGRSVNANRTNAIGNLVATGGTWPLLLRETSRLGPPSQCTAAGQTGCIPQTVSYPLTATLNNNIAIFDPDIQLSYTRSYQVGFQRALTQDMAIEVRYVGNQNVGGWTTENWNERNIYENGFLEEFKLAQANLLSHVASGCGATINPCSFAYRGPGTGTSPLPIYLAHFTGLPASQAGNAANYANANFSNTTFVGRLNRYEPQVTNNGNNDAVNDLFSSATFRANMLAAGLPANFWVMNPQVGDANVRTSATSSRYHSIQTELRRRLSRGFLVNGSYTYARRYGSNLDTLHDARYLSRSTNVPHSFKFNAYYEAPFGRGKRFGANINRWVDGVIGGWTASATGRFQVQTLSIDNARLVGMTLEELQSEYKIRIDGDKVVRMMPDDIILNSQRAFSTSATSADGYSGLGAPQGRYIAPASYAGCVRVKPGDCGEPQNIFLTSPLFTRVDLSLKKQFPLGGRRSFEITYDINNLFNNINFNPVFSTNNLNSTTVFQTNAHYTDISQSYDPGGRLGQIIVRVNW
jgi:hypothetical protein